MCTCLYVIFSTGEVMAVVNKKESTHQQGTISAYNLSEQAPVMTNEVNDAMDNEAADSEDKMTNATVSDKIGTDSDNSSSTLISEGNTDIVQAQPMEALTVSTQPQATVTGSKEDDSVVSASSQSTLTQSCDDMSETTGITHSISQPITTMGMIIINLV